jgi:toxin secretion/phage lysis holin
MLEIIIDLAHGGVQSVEQPAEWYAPFAALYAQYPAIAVLLALMFIDIFSGILQAIVKWEISSKIGAKGMNKKCMTMGVVAVAWLFELVAPKVGGLTVSWGQVIALWYSYVECVSIIENAGKAGVPVPRWFLKEVQRIRDKEESEATPVVAVKEAVKELKASSRDVVHDVVDRLGGKLQTIEAEVKEVIKSHDSGVISHNDIVREPHAGNSGDSAGKTQ